jgi:metal-dependent amidase/aminoacylase/carboxypeptidase family protein
MIQPIQRREATDAMRDRLIAHRRDLHQHLELAFQVAEHR